MEREYKVTRPAIDVGVTELSDEEIETLHRPEMPVIAPARRTGNFDEVQMGFTAEQAIAEAKRCLRCDRDVGQLEHGRGQIDEEYAVAG